MSIKSPMHSFERTIELTLSLEGGERKWLSGNFVKSFPKAWRVPLQNGIAQDHFPTTSRHLGSSWQSWGVWGEVWDFRVICLNLQLINICVYICCHSNPNKSKAWLDVTEKSSFIEFPPPSKKKNPWSHKSRHALLFSHLKILFKPFFVIGKENCKEKKL